jgi:hypothetical protein
VRPQSLELSTIPNEPQAKGLVFSGSNHLFVILPDQSVCRNMTSVQISWHFLQPDTKMIDIPSSPSLFRDHQSCPARRKMLSGSVNIRIYAPLHISFKRTGVATATRYVAKHTGETSEVTVYYTTNVAACVIELLCNWPHLCAYPSKSPGVY